MSDLSNAVAPQLGFLPAPPQFPPRPAGVRPLSLAIEDSSSSVYNHTAPDMFKISKPESARCSIPGDVYDPGRQIGTLQDDPQAQATVAR